ncbi:alpha/beta fold hydrolase [Mucilaginibacter rubeus]|uniref:Alpha/beta hydrolase n=1 Tax=Mucilaginibacter rubeus TaxID=2027860 RepID=A0A5C1I1H9_9SPHI|nr:alpha/beta hydrolase [Mucilaginibacter rubeus]QEM11694.1 alpha/beta hydrolase [Mucilaginibacter rubeus]
MLNYRKTGHSQSAIIFVHGNSQSLHTWDSVVIQNALQKYTLISVDLPGLGLSFRSNNPDADYTIKGLAQHLNTFLAQIHEKEFILVGTSLGTSIIGEIKAFPLNCKGIFLCGAMLTSRNIMVKDMIRPGVSIAAAFKATPADEEIDFLIDHFIFKDNQPIKDHYKMVFKKTDPQFRAALGNSLRLPNNATDKIANLIAANLPTAMAFGSQERLIQTDYLEQSGLPKWRNEIFKIPKAGHCIELDQPAALATLIGAFASDGFR